MTKKKMQLVAVVLALSFFVPGFSSAKNVKLDDDGGNASFTITTVAPKEVSPATTAAVTITGTGFTSGLKAGIIAEGNTVSSAASLTDISGVFVSATQMTATIPSGLTGDEYDLYVYDPSASTFTFAKKEEGIEVEVESDDSLTLEHSNNAARRKVDVTFDGVSNVTKKRWMKVKVGGKNVPILKLVKVDGNTITLKLNLKYKGLAAGVYPLVLTYKWRISTVVGTKKNGKSKIQRGWQTGTSTNSTFLTII